METVKLGCWEDLFKLPRFTAPVLGAEMKQGQVVQSYHMPEKAGERKCGIAECGTNHRRGFLILLPDERLSHVGRRCGSKHFGATSWDQQMASLKQRQKAAAAVEALQEARRAAKDAIQRAQVPAGGQAHALALLTRFDHLPDAVRFTLERRAETNDSIILRTRLPTEAEQKRARFHGNPPPKVVDIQIGKIEHLSAVSERGRLDSKLAFLGRLVLNLERKLADEKASAMELIETAGRVNAAHGRVPAAVEDTLAFFSETNLLQIEKLIGCSPALSNLLQGTSSK